MKKFIILIFIVAVAITLNSCKKCTVYYACCGTGHASWQGSEHESCGGDRAESQQDAARMDATAHDTNIHGGVGTAGVCSDYK